MSRRSPSARRVCSVMVLGVGAFAYSTAQILKEAVYGLPEFLFEQIRGATLVANPGCYATAAVLPLITV